MPRHNQDYETDPARNPDAQREEREDPELELEGDLERPGFDPERSVARHAEEAEESELAEEDILEIADLEDELDAHKGDGNDRRE
jgi:hypothetical protein